MGQCEKNRNLMDQLHELICTIEKLKPEPEICNVSCPPLGCPRGPCPGMCCYQGICDACCLSEMPCCPPPEPPCFCPPPYMPPPKAHSFSETHLRPFFPNPCAPKPPCKPSVKSSCPSRPPSQPCCPKPPCMSPTVSCCPSRKPSQSFCPNLCVAKPPCPPPVCPKCCPPPPCQTVCIPCCPPPCYSPPTTWVIPVITVPCQLK
ncbi:DBF4-type zinc finger-containing protein 2 homolog [Orussus abietinus]|uniref:DBF4-type zinc finger-containing protein 2 homolog n=1 Tax=Orussus abietinus TaxID=222816 RepID=UPI000625F41F|nr:DBF4-type zinc finger-containing protein 2 homolog [Orussus abietinus]